MTFLEAVKAYLVGNGFTGSISLDNLPDTPDEATGIFLFSSPSAGDGTVTRYVQVECRAGDRLSAYNKASEMFPHFDSGPDEAKIFLTPGRWGIGRIRSRPRILKTDSLNRAVYYFEFSFFCEDIP